MTGCALKVEREDQGTAHQAPRGDGQRCSDGRCRKSAIARGTAHEQELRLPTHAVKCIAKAILPRPANVKPGRDEGAAFALLVDNTVRTWGKVDGCRCFLSNHSCKETREDDDAHFHVCFPYIAQPSRAVRSHRSCSSMTETGEAVAQTHHRLLSRCGSTWRALPVQEPLEPVSVCHATTMPPVRWDNGSDAARQRA